MKTKICIIGLGYVGLPIYLRLSKYFETIGYDNNLKRVSDLNNGHDFNLEYKKKELFFSKKKGKITQNIDEVKECNFYIIAVPTPIFKNKNPDLRILINSCKLIGKILKKNDIVFFESTVYPGVTNKICRITLEKISGLKSSKDFFLGYSPERINPGDKTKKLSTINKIVAFNDNNLKRIKVVKDIFKKISKKITYTKDLESAETAKVIENIQRDLNIGLFNEIYKFCDKANINFKEVIRLASTKWNFIKYKPGLVGGHCLPVDPYYLSYISKKHKLKMEILLAGRNVNNQMEIFVYKKILRELNKHKLNLKNKILIAGESYKPNVGDQRNSIAQKIIVKLLKKNNKIKVFDPTIDNKNFYKSYRINFLNYRNKYDAIIQLVDHDIGYKEIKKYLNKNKKTIFIKIFN
jgi:UDP-N-acetyl-D-glucosamine/UDP-N-acetyl-D-galactosamine dehydrogenase